MILTWMAYAVAVGFTFAIAALAAERAARLCRAPTRWIWTAAMVASLIVPAAVPTLSIEIPAVSPTSDPSRTVVLRDIASLRLGPFLQVDDASFPVPASPRLDSTLVSAWWVISIGLLLALLASHVQGVVRSRQWARVTLEGRPVQVAPHSGPAVVGLLRPVIVVPQWLLQWPTSQRRAVVEHEQSHIDARDPQLVLLGLCLLACVPWNLPLWWQFLRLRRALEVDCDLRLLNSGQNARHYSQTLVAVGERQSGIAGIATAMAEPRTFLEERLALILHKPTRRWQVTALLFGTLALVLCDVAAQIAPPNAAPSADPQGQAAREVTLDSNTLERPVGYYQFVEGGVLEVFRNGPRLMARLTGQPALEIFPKSATEFYYKAVDAQISFQLDQKGQIDALVLHQNGQDLRMRRIDAVAAKELLAQSAARMERKTPTPGSEAALRRLIAGIAAGNPNYDEMSPELAQVTRQQLPKLHAAISGLGAVQSLEFRGVGNQGWDMYDVKQEGGRTRWSIMLGAGGAITGAWVAGSP